MGSHVVLQYQKVCTYPIACVRHWRLFLPCGATMVGWNDYHDCGRNCQFCCLRLRPSNPSDSSGCVEYHCQASPCPNAFKFDARCSSTFQAIPFDSNAMPINTYSPKGRLPDQLSLPCMYVSEDVRLLSGSQVNCGVQCMSWHVFINVSWSACVSTVYFTSATIPGATYH